MQGTDFPVGAMRGTEPDGKVQRENQLGKRDKPAFFLPLTQAGRGAA
jgi:hypothetical protein